MLIFLWVSKTRYLINFNRSINLANPRCWTIFLPKSFNFAYSFSFFRSIYIIMLNKCEIKWVLLLSCSVNIWTIGLCFLTLIGREWLPFWYGFAFLFKFWGLHFSEGCFYQTNFLMFLYILLPFFWKRLFSIFIKVWKFIYRFFHQNISDNLDFFFPIFFSFLPYVVLYNSIASLLYQWFDLFHRQTWFDSFFTYLKIIYPGWPLLKLNLFWTFKLDL